MHIERCPSRAESQARLKSFRKTQIDFVGPGTLRLAVQCPIGLGDGVGVEQASRSLGFDEFGKLPAGPFAVDDTVDRLNGLFMV